MTHGQYLDTVASSTQGAVSRHYRIKRVQPGSTLWVNMVGRMPHARMLEGIGRGDWTWTLSTLDGVECSSLRRIDNDTQGVGIVTTGTVVVLPLDPRVAEPEESAVACAEADEFLYEVTRGKGRTADSPQVEIRVYEEPQALNVDELPAGVPSVPSDNSAQLVSPAAGEPVTVIGGAGFNDALEVAPGTYRTEVVPGELVFFSTRIDWGQEAIFAIDGPDPTFALLQEFGPTDYLHLSGNVYAPDFSQMDSHVRSVANYRFVGRLDSDPGINQVPTVNYRNRRDSPGMSHPPSRGFALAGDYHFAVGGVSLWFLSSCDGWSWLVVGPVAEHGVEDIDASSG